MKPPSPWIGSATIAATLWAPTCVRTVSSRAAKASSAACSLPEGHRYGYGDGTR